MKKLILSSVIMFGMSIAYNASAQIVVKIKPIKPKTVIVKSKAPSSKHIWLDGHWNWSKASQKYVWKKSYWVIQKPGQAWVKGYWTKLGNGHKWIVGHWKTPAMYKHPKKRSNRRRNR